MPLDKEKIKHVAKLARISVDEAKVESLTKDLNSIFKFIEQLNELNTDKVEPLTSILNQSLRSRKDEISDGKIREKILKSPLSQMDQSSQNLPAFKVSFIEARAEKETERGRSLADIKQSWGWK